ncbi:MAG: hypothetical protein HYR48_06370 [Gemmatimonadetes bacterium]|nr:hypothetical protein [Gemmatimonadota bacterium]
MRKLDLPSPRHEAFYVASVTLLLSLTVGRLLPAGLHSLITGALRLAVVVTAALVVLYLVRHRTRRTAAHALVALVVAAGVLTLAPLRAPSRAERMRERVPALEPLVREILAAPDSLCNPYGNEESLRQRILAAGFMWCTASDQYIAFRGGGFLDDAWGVLLVRRGQPARGGGVEGAPIASLEPLGGVWYYYRTH